jgi:hypothetical protein
MILKFSKSNVPSSAKKEISQMVSKEKSFEKYDHLGESSGYCFHGKHIESTLSFHGSDGVKFIFYSLHAKN